MLTYQVYFDLSHGHATVNAPMFSRPRDPLAHVEGSPYGRHIPALDGLRGIAICGVAGSHLFPGTPRSDAARLIASVLSFGSTGVDLFFVLSGFLITGILYDSRADPHFFKKFYARRALRIFPLYYGVLACFFLLTLFFGFNYNRELLSLALYLQNTHLIARPIYAYLGPRLPLAHFWSLAVEEQFYLVWPLLVFWLYERERILVCCLASLVLCPLLRFGLALHSVGYFAIHTNTFCRADSLLAGGLLALLLRGPRHYLVLRWGPRLFLGGLLAALTLRSGNFVQSTASLPYALSMGWSYTALAVASVGLLAMALHHSFMQKLLGSASLRWLGRYSYGLYVVHVILFAYVQDPLKHRAADIGASKGVAVLFVGAVAFACSCLFAYLCFKYYERHFLRLKRLFAYEQPVPAGGLLAVSR